MSKKGMTMTVLATGLAEAVAKDEGPDAGGFDLSAGMFGENVSGWLREVLCEVQKEEFPAGWWKVFPGAEKLDLGPRVPVACFKYRDHAKKYGIFMWPGLFEVEEVNPEA